MNHATDRSDGPNSQGSAEHPSNLERGLAWTGRHLETLIDLFNRGLANRIVWFTAIGFAIILQAVLIITHRPWLDEWQSLGLAVQSPHLADLLISLRYEGHPPLWYLILRGLSQLFDNPERSLPVAALLIAIPVQLTILLAAPFSRAERLMIALSEFFLFEFMTLSRSLTLGVAMMIVIAAVWKRDRLVWLPIAILPQCDFLFGVISLVFIALRWRQRRIYWPGAVCWLIASLIAAWSIRPMPDVVPALPPGHPLQEFFVWCSSLSTLGLPLQWNVSNPQWNMPPPIQLCGVALMAFLAMSWNELRKNKDHERAFWIYLLFTLVFSVAVYELSNRHLMISAALLIVLVWRQTDDAGGTPDEKRSIWWKAWLLGAAICGLITATVNLVEPFDTAPEAAATIRKLGLQDKSWVAFPHSAAEGVAEINSMKFERLMNQCSEDVIRWNEPSDLIVRNVIMKHNLNDLEKMFTRRATEQGKYYMLSWFYLEDHPPFLRKIAVIPHGYDGQNFVLYVVGENLPDARPHRHPCITPLLPLRPVSHAADKPGAR